MSYDMLNCEVKNPTPRASSGTPWSLRARSGVGAFSFNGAGGEVASAALRTTWQTTTGGREGG